MKRKITLKQIAKELDVSVSTVSKALKDSREISIDTKDKVKAFAKLYNYKPNNIALSLKNRKTKTIGIIIPEIVHYFFTTVIQGIEHVANEKGYNVIICLSNNSFDKEVLNLEFLANGSTDGFILSVAKETQQKEDYHHINEVISQGMPVVMFDRVIDEVICDKVIISDKHGAFEAVQYLIDQSCKKIALISTVDYVSVGKLRTEGYQEALITNDIPINPELILKIEDVDHSEERIEAFFSDKDIDAVFAVNEKFAVNAIKALTKLGKKIPDDISVIGFTDGVVSKSFIPSLSTVNQHGEEMGAKAASLLIDRLEDKVHEQSFQTTVLNTSLIIRDSVKRKTDSL
ncbi:LacI family DNA-binding transcriptional regulator [Mesonia aestuariivivens]|uniref:LacI family transcriptional regulator n=1 Tax=Mesonia aestuariivivens TaxID=2796128 RepID=A0ABS6W4S5_9FLAO|nr:LacI family DNA-binding transcriptional regulator [Mesonia aestuariivivens]MBW2962486.1 LacI family transcriptional regulator [Mesonia aestuariivivens]